MQPEEYYKTQEILTGKKFPDYDVAARNLQRDVGESEKEKLNQGLNQYSEEEARLAVVYTRSDLILIVSYTRWITAGIRDIVHVLWIIAVLLALVVCKYLFFS